MCLFFCCFFSLIFSPFGFLKLPLPDRSLGWRWRGARVLLCNAVGRGRHIFLPAPPPQEPCAGGRAGEPLAHHVLSGPCGAGAAWPPRYLGAVLQCLPLSAHCVFSPCFEQIADLANEDTPQLYVACGRGPRSTLRVLRHGLEVCTQAYRHNM